MKVYVLEGITNPGEDYLVAIYESMESAEAFCKKKKYKREEISPTWIYYKHPNNACSTSNSPNAYRITEMETEP